MYSHLYYLCALWLFIQFAQSAQFSVSQTGVGGCGLPVQVTATLLDDYGAPIVGATVFLATANDQTARGLTDVSGKFTYNGFVYPNAGSYPISASYVNGSAVFAQWTSQGEGIYQGVLPGNILITVQASSLTELPLAAADLSDPETYKYPGSSTTQAITYNADDQWRMTMTPNAEGILLYMKNWFTLAPYQFSEAFKIISPFEPTDQKYTMLVLTDDPWDVTDAYFSGLLMFPDSLSSLEMSTEPQDGAIPQVMTLALAPINGVLYPDATVTVSCCTPLNPQLTYSGALFVPNIWVWTPSVTLTVNGVPQASKSVTLSVNDMSGGPIFASCTATTDAQGKATCQLATNLQGHWKISLNAQFIGDGCALTSVSFSQQLTVFGFPDAGHHAFIVSSNVMNKHIGDKVVFSGIDWLGFNPFGLHDERSERNRNGDDDQQGNNGNGKGLGNLITFGGYVNADVSTPKCSGTFTWTKNLLKNLPNQVPQNLGVLVASNLGASGVFNGQWDKIVVLTNIKYSKTLGLQNGWGKLAGTYCTGATFIAPPVAPAFRLVNNRRPTTKKPTTKKPTTKKPNKKKKKQANRTTTARPNRP
jgi:hypothetical protein